MNEVNEAMETLKNFCSKQDDCDTCPLRACDPSSPFLCKLTHDAPCAWLINDFKPVLSEDEKTILSCLPKEWIYIFRGTDAKIWIETPNSIHFNLPYSALFQTLEIGKRYTIAELLAE